MDSTITVIVALITALAAIIAPLVTAQINSKSALKLKTIETVYAKKVQAYTEFANKCGGTYQASFVDPYREMHSASYGVLVLADEHSKEMLLSMLEYVKHTTPLEPTVLSTHFECCMLALSNDLQQSKQANR